MLCLDERSRIVFDCAVLFKQCDGHTESESRGGLMRLNASRRPKTYITAQTLHRVCLASSRCNIRALNSTFPFVGLLLYGVAKQTFKGVTRTRCARIVFESNEPSLHIHQYADSDRFSTVLIVGGHYQKHLVTAYYPRQPPDLAFHPVSSI